MREILFRAYDKGRKEYLSDGHLFIAINKDNRPNKSEIYLDVISNADKHKDRFTIEQYTGLADKNGRKIFEGDILKVPNWDCYGNVVYSVPECRFEISMESGYWVPMHDFASEVEIIGNIHDNPELLKGGAE